MPGPWLRIVWVYVAQAQVDPLGAFCDRSYASAMAASLLLKDSSNETGARSRAKAGHFALKLATLQWSVE